MQSEGINQKSILFAIAALVFILGLTYYKLQPKGGVDGAMTKSVECFDDKSCQGANFHQGQTIGACRDCVLLKDTVIPVAKDIGEYVDYKLAAKLRRLAQINSNWRLTEAFPPTVRHLSFCHQNGTCVDLGLYYEKRNSKELSQLCKDALRIGLTIVNEYADPRLYSAKSLCPASNVFETTTGGHLHAE